MEMNFFFNHTFWAVVMLVVAVGALAFVLYFFKDAKNAYESYGGKSRNLVAVLISRVIGASLLAAVVAFNPPDYSGFKLLDWINMALLIGAAILLISDLGRLFRGSAEPEDFECDESTPESEEKDCDTYVRGAIAGRMGFASFVFGALVSLVLFL